MKTKPLDQIILRSRVTNVAQNGLKTVCKFWTSSLEKYMHTLNIVIIVTKKGKTKVKS